MKLDTDTSTLLSQKEDTLVQALNVLGDKTRFKIFKLLLSDRELCVSEIASELGVSNSAVSQHFRLFELAKIVIKKRYGQKVCHALDENSEVVMQLKKII